MIPPLQSKLVKLGAALGVLLASGLHSAAHADIPATERGQPACLVAPRNVPGYSGLPIWPAADGAAPDATKNERNDVDDPRWGSAALTGIMYPNNVNNARYRLQVQGNILAVSIQVAEDPNGADEQDYVLFGIAKKDGTKAWGVKVSPMKFVGGNPVHGANIVASKDNDIAFTYAESDANGVAIPAADRWKSIEGTAAIPWIERGTAQYWSHSDRYNAQNQVLPNNDKVQNGAEWAVQFRVDLNQLDISTTDSASFFAGVHMFEGRTSEGRDLYSDFGSSNFLFCTGGCKVYPHYAAPDVLDVAFPVDPREWTPLSSFAGTCDGISLDTAQIKSNFDSSGLNVSVLTGRSNSWTISPSLYSGLAAGNLPADAIRARMSVANWGTVATVPEWSLIASKGNDKNSNNINISCVNSLPGQDNICGVVDAAAIRNSDHQCVTVTLSSGDTSNPAIKFKQPTAYRNQYYQWMSEINETAEVSVRGLDALLKNDVDRDVYLHVVPRNMPPAGSTTMSINVPALQALRAQLEPGYAATLGCSLPIRPLCVNAECARTCVDLDENGVRNECSSTEVRKYVNNTCYCFAPREQRDECGNINGVAPAGGGYNPSASALTPSQKILAEFPNIEVYPYYEASRVVVNGRTRSQLRAMPSFGLILNHAGAFYGFLQDLLKGDGTQIAEVRPNLFKLTIPKAQNVAKVSIVASAVEDADFETFSEISGTATILGLGLGNVQISGVTETMQTVDLSKATVRIDHLLDENGVDLVANLGGPVVLNRQAGATPFSASFASTVQWGKPTITMQIVTVPFIGQVTSIQVLGATVNRPKSCGLFFGVSDIATGFTITDGVNPAIDVRGDDRWTCVPFEIFN